MYVLNVNTPNAKGIEITINIALNDTGDLSKFVDAEKFSEMCSLYCKNYGSKWSCPPYSPNYNVYCNSHHRIVIFLLSTKLHQFNYIKLDYLKVKAANAILKSRADIIAERLSQKIKGRRISSGSCRLCKPCKMKSGIECAKPDRMAPSFEAMGMDVEQLTKVVFQHELLWYKNRVLPNYTSVVVGVTTNEHISIEELHSYLRDIEFPEFGS